MSCFSQFGKLEMILFFQALRGHQKTGKTLAFFRRGNGILVGPWKTHVSCHTGLRILFFFNQ